MANKGLIKTTVSDFLNSLLRKPGDRFEARVTNSGRQVIKAENTEIKYSATKYPSTGTVVETKVTRRK